MGVSLNKDVNRLNKYRRKIDSIDNRIIKLLKARLKYVEKIGNIKKQNGLEISDQKRENFIIRKIEKSVNPEDVEPIKEIYSTIFEISKKIESNNNTHRQ